MTGRKQAEEGHELLADEMSHRVKIASHCFRSHSHHFVVRQDDCRQRRLISERTKAALAAKNPREVFWAMFGI